MSISKLDFIDWKANPVTEALFEALRADRNMIVEAWVAGSTTDPLEAARNSGIASCVDGILEWSPIEDDE